MEFTFNASALGVGGVISQRNMTNVIPSLASVALAPSGGEGRSVIDNYYSEELEFKHAETRVSGREIAKNVFSTYTYVFLKDVRVLDKLTIGELRATVESTRDFEGGDDHKFQLSASYTNVAFGKVVIEPKIDIELVACERYEDMEKLLRKPNPDENLLQRFGAHTKNRKNQLDERVAQRKLVQGSVVRELEKGHRVGQVTAHKVHIPKFGTVRFGELLMKPGRRRLNLLRIAFGKNEPQDILREMQLEALESPERSALFANAPNFDEGPPDREYDGSMTIASVEGNGSPVVP